MCSSCTNTLCMSYIMLHVHATFWGCLCASKETWFVRYNIFFHCRHEISATQWDFFTLLFLSSDSPVAACMYKSKIINLFQFLEQLTAFHLVWVNFLEIAFHLMYACAKQPFPPVYLKHVLLCKVSERVVYLFIFFEVDKETHQKLWCDHWPHPNHALPPSHQALNYITCIFFGEKCCTCTLIINFSLFLALGACPSEETILLLILLAVVKWILKEGEIELRGTKCDTHMHTHTHTRCKGHAHELW